MKWLVPIVTVMVMLVGCWKSSPLDGAAAPDGDADTDADADVDSDSDSDSDTDTGSDTDTDVDSDSDADSDTDTGTDTDADTNAETDGDTDTGIDGGPEHVWSMRFGDWDSDVCLSIAVDSSDNVIVTGYFKDTVDFGGGPQTSAGDMDVFLAKYDADGDHLWSMRFGSVGWDIGRSVAVDSSDNIVVTGRFDVMVDFGGGLLNSGSGSDIFLAKYDPDGDHLWSMSFGDEDEESGESVAVDSSDNVIVTGFFEGTADFGGGPLTSPGVNRCDGFLAKYDADGDHLWSMRFGDVERDSGSSVAVDGADNIALTGGFNGSVDFGGGPLESAVTTAKDVFVVEYDSAGEHLWSVCFGDTSADWGASTAVDGSDNVVVSGAFRGTIDPGGGPLTSVDTSNYDMFVVKYSSTGDHIWSKSFGDTSDDLGASIALTGLDDVLLTGYFGGTVDFGGGPLTVEGFDGGRDIFAAGFDAGGDHLWSRSYGEWPAGDEGRALAVDGAGDILLGGTFWWTVDFGGGPLTSDGKGDIFLVKFGW